MISQLLGCLELTGLLRPTFLIELHHLSALVILGGVEGVEAPGVSPQLLHCTGSEGVAGSDQHVELVLDQPEANLS